MKDQGKTQEKTQPHLAKFGPEPAHEHRVDREGKGSDILKENI